MAEYDWHTDLRVEALREAVRWRSSVQTNQPFGHPQAHDVVLVAEVFYRWLATGRRRDFLTLTASNLRPISPAHAGTSVKGNIMANPQVPVGYQFDLTVSPVDVLGNPVADTLTWTNSDTSGATALTVDDATTLKVTIAVTGTVTDAVVTATDANGLTGSYAFDGVPDVATALTLAPSTPVRIPAAS
jgi:hypothetical protein